MRILLVCVMVAACAAACGDDGRGESGGQSASASQGSLTTITAGSVTTVGATEGGSGEASGGATEPKLDVAGHETEDDGGGDCGVDTPEFKESFAFLWIANSLEGTVSKIEIATGVEVGRYRVGPGVPDPSRTSVNLFGDVAVADRAGGIVKIASAKERCADRDQDGTIETSSGPADVRVWGEDECVLWRTELPSGDGMVMNSAGPRPVAWEARVDDVFCPKQNPRVWVGWYDYPAKTGEFRRIDGATGEIADAVTVADWGDRKHGPYGGAVNQRGDLWALGWDSGPLVRVDAETLEVERVEVMPPPGDAEFYLYGIAVDREGNPWLAGEQTIYGYDAAAGTWTHVAIPEGRMRGLQIDRRGRAFIALNNPAGLVELDTASASVIAPMIALPGALMPVGVSIDVDGAVWVVDRDAERAYKVDALTHEVLLTTEGLVAPYTYSDMTGAGLALVTYPPVG